MNMYDSGNYMDVTWRPDYNYLDKPPLLFWLSAFFFSIFGVNHFAYRLPSILINLLGIFSTYKLGKKLYNEQVGLYSAIIYAGNFAIFIINHDVSSSESTSGSFETEPIFSRAEYKVDCIDAMPSEADSPIAENCWALALNAIIAIRRTYFFITITLI